MLPFASARLFDQGIINLRVCSWLCLQLPCPEVGMPSACRRVFSGAVKVGLVAPVWTYTTAMPSTYDDDFIWEYI